LFALLALQPAAANATEPPRTGGSLPQAYYDRLTNSPTALRFGHAFLALTEKARKNREAIQQGAQPLGLVDKVSGHKRLIVLLVQYNDTHATPYKPQDLAQRLFDQSGSPSLSAYYHDNSYGSLDLTGDVTPWVSLSHAESYYAGHDSQCYGLCDTSKVAEMVEEAVKLNDAKTHWGQYDNDGIDDKPNTSSNPNNGDDGRVDFVVIIHPGRGAECENPSPTSLWSHHDRLTGWPDHTAANTTSKNYNGKGGFITVDDYILVPAVGCDGHTPIPIGVIAHEIGHAFGLPDLYDTSRNPRSEGLGNWDLMAGGAWGGDGNSPEQPVHMSAWSKAFLGWVNPKDVTSDTTNITLHPFETSGEVFLITIRSDLAAGINEYYLISNRQKLGFDSKIPGVGMLILYINEATLAAGLSINRVNVDPNLMGVAVIEADGLNQMVHHNGATTFRGGPGDTFPGSHGRTSFENSTSPGTTVPVAICSISSAANAVNFNLLFSRGDCTPAFQQLPPAVSLKTLTQSPHSFSNVEIRISGTLMNEARNYFRDPLNLFLSDGEGYKVRVAPWIRMETPPNQKGMGPPTIPQYLNQPVELTGALTPIRDEIPWIFHVRHARILR